MTSLSYEAVIDRIGILDILAPFDPHVVGTLPLGIALPNSDIDIVCQASDPDVVANLLWTAFSSADDFTLYRWSARGRPLIAKFKAESWPFEIFASTELVAEQSGWQHFVVERQLLDLAGFALRDQIMALRLQGMKTEPAFATALGLPGDPYEAMRALYWLSEMELAEIISNSPEL
ncbi:DUF4269 domain-containing protein [Tardiphaga alba]|uniref:DUF4269 domain-containing protein n=2 Tax=Tardiphaga alba TaxID=340268 RepID=A0ABX8AEK4_9BRAD|nr:DUF4269 domain-containing protein [Tardiphaga alba]